MQITGQIVVKSECSCSGLGLKNKLYKLTNMNGWYQLCLVLVRLSIIISLIILISN